MARQKPDHDKEKANAVILRRRSLLKGLGTLIGGVAAARLVGAPGVVDTALAYTPRADSLTSEGLTFSREQMAVLHDVCDQVLPATDIPGDGIDQDCDGSDATADTGNTDTPDDTGWGATLQNGPGK